MTPSAPVLKRIQLTQIFWAVARMPFSPPVVFWIQYIVFLLNSLIWKAYYSFSKLQFFIKSDSILLTYSKTASIHSPQRLLGMVCITASSFSCGFYFKGFVQIRTALRGGNRVLKKLYIIKMVNRIICWDVIWEYFKPSVWSHPST